MRREGSDIGLDLSCKPGTKMYCIVINSPTRLRSEEHIVHLLRRF